MQKNNLVEIQLEEESILPTPIALGMQMGATMMGPTGSLVTSEISFKINKSRQIFTLRLAISDVVLLQTSRPDGRDYFPQNNWPDLFEIIKQIIKAGEGDILGLIIEHVEPVLMQINIHYVKGGSLIVGFKNECSIPIPIGLGLALIQRLSVPIYITRKLIKQLSIPYPEIESTVEKTKAEDSKIAVTFVQRIGQCLQDNNISETALLIYQLAQINRSMALKVLAEIFDKSQNVRDQIIQIYKQDAIIISNMTLDSKTCRQILSETLAK